MKRLTEKMSASPRKKRLHECHAGPLFCKAKFNTKTIELLFCNPVHKWQRKTGCLFRADGL